MNKQLVYNVFNHFGLWFIYLLLPIIIIPRQEIISIEKSQFLLFNYFLSSLYSILFFYVNFFWAIPEVSIQKQKNGNT